MKYWVFINNNQIGPFTADEMRQVDFNALTPAWHEGLPDWVQAGQIDELKAIIDEREASKTNRYQATPDVQPDQPIYSEPQPRPAAQTVFSQPQSNLSTAPAAEQRPSNYLVWAIIVTILCNLIMGVIAIIFASKVNSAYDRGDIEAARRNSDRAQWFIIFSIVLGVVWSPFQILLWS